MDFSMAGRQAKILNKHQQESLLRFIELTRSPERNRVIALLSLKAGLRAKEIAEIKWSMVTDSDDRITNTLNLTDAASKGTSGGSIPMARDLRTALIQWRRTTLTPQGEARIVNTERASYTSAQVIVNLFADWYRRVGFEGCSSHTGRRTFITNAARNIGKFGGSLRDVQALARHRSLSMTQRYIDQNSDAMRRVVDA